MKRIIMMAVGCAMLAVPVFAQGDAAKGEAAYAANKCAMCHQVAGKGNKATPLDGVGTKLKADDMRKWLMSPAEMKSTKKPPMKSFSTLPKADIDNLIAYLSTLK